MKKTLSVLLLLSVLLSVCSCGKKYKPVKSTDEESRVVMTFTAGGEEYEIRYELYRALFLANKATVDGGDGSVWQGESAGEYIAAINAIIIEKASYIYSVLHLADSLDIDVNSSEADDFVEECIRIGVEGDGSTIVGAGSYDSYLASLKTAGMNYAVSELMLRYSYALSKINEYYIGEANDALGNLGGALDTEEDKLRAFYNSEDCVRVLRAYVPEAVKSKEWVEDFRDDIEALSSDEDRALFIINKTAAAYSELLLDGELTGIVIGRYSLDKTYYADYSEGAFSLEVGEVSQVITVDGTGDTGTDGYYVLVALEKSSNHFESNLNAVKEAYISNEIGKTLDGIARSLIDSTVYESAYTNIVHKDISMDP